MNEEIKIVFCDDAKNTPAKINVKNVTHIALLTDIKADLSKLPYSTKDLLDAMLEHFEPFINNEIARLNLSIPSFWAQVHRDPIQKNTMHVRAFFDKVNIPTCYSVFARFIEFSPDGGATQFDGTLVFVVKSEEPHVVIYHGKAITTKDFDTIGLQNPPKKKFFRKFWK
jgi:hypothetical protein